jgi:hypothetical protein
MNARALWLVAGSVMAMSGPVSAEAPPGMCGRPSDMVKLIIEMQATSTESLWRDKKMFVSRVSEDGSLWAFSLKNTNAHPSAICERQVKDGDTMKTETGFMCPANEKVCKSFAAQANERLAIIKGEAKK